MRFDWGAASDPGRVRPANEDAAVAEDGLFAVADGMGGHAAGEIASRVAVEALRTSSGDGLVEAVRVANRAVLDRAAEDPALRGMGTTMCALALVEGEPPQVLVVNVGDSRAYLYRDGELQQLTDDHNLVAELEREGRITHEEALVHPQRNIITRVLGNDPDVEVDEFPVDVFRGDRFLICSDGLFNEVRDDAIADVLRSRKGPQEAADELVRRANAGGGRDNISVVVVDVVDDDGRAKRASAALAGSASKTISPPAGTVTGTIEEPITDRDRMSARDERVEVVPERRRKLTVRSAAFTLALLVVAVAAVGSVWWFARNTFYVGVDDGEVTIFRGRPGGVLWLEPTVEQRTGLEVGDLAPARQEDVRAGKDEATLADARGYVATLRRSTTTTTTSTTTTTTSSIPSFTPLPPTSAP